MKEIGILEIIRKYKTGDQFSVIVTSKDDMDLITSTLIDKFSAKWADLDRWGYAGDKTSTYRLIVSPKHKSFSMTFMLDSRVATFSPLILPREYCEYESLKETYDAGSGN